ncbi:CBASS oligonucleotide cyclase [Paenibacillus gansuensis]|uniref:CBASS oligonucleotide cyclase n=1 Tax=Paenibacillus gansuensis TaxID=306542 RepID=A0ABW5PAW7_9BACL
MPKSITQSFSSFKQNLEITDLQGGTVSTRQKNVRGVLDNGLTVLDSFLTGSYSRSTMIAPLKEADVDIFVVLDPSYYKKDGPAYLLDKVKGVLRQEYKTPDISRNGQAVTIWFSDFMVDVVPSFYRQGGGYLIPNTITKQWVETDPKKHVTLFSQANQSHNSMLKPVIKMLKCWNKNISFEFSNFHIEVLAYHIFNNVRIDDYSSGVRYFFDKARSEVRKQNPDPSGFSADVGAYLNSEAKILKAVSNLTTAYNRAVKAETNAAEGRIEDAVNEWRKIFGSRFPSYG